MMALVRGRTALWCLVSILWVLIVLATAIGYGPLWNRIAPAFGEPYAGFEDGDWPPLHCAGSLTDPERPEDCLSLDRGVDTWITALSTIGWVAAALVIPPLLLLGLLLWTMRARL